MCIGRAETHPSADVRIRLVSELARSSGIGGMAGGQMLDLAAEEQFGDAAAGTEASILMLQSMKTGALIRWPARGRRDSRRRRRTPTRCARPLRHCDRPSVPDRGDDLLDVEAMPRPSARRPARMRRAAKRRWSACSASPAPGRGSRN